MVGRIEETQRVAPKEHNETATQVRKRIKETTTQEAESKAPDVHPHTKATLLKPDITPKGDC